MNNNQNNPSTIIQILIGFGIALLSYAIAIGTFYITGSMILIAIMAIILITLFAFLVVKFFRKGYKAMAITMLAMISPLIFMLLFYGACAIILLPFS